MLSRSPFQTLRLRQGGVAALTVSIFLLAVPAGANFCAFDAAPAASLLFPFVVIDFNDPDQQTRTILTVTNMATESQVVHVTLWSDFGLPVFDFNMLLTGYDVQEIDIGEILTGGQLPVTVSSGHTVFEGAQDYGPVSSANDLNGEWLEEVLPPPEATTALGERCTADMIGYPGNYTAIIPQTILDLFEIWLTVSQRVQWSISDDCDQPFADPYVPDIEHWFIEREFDQPTWMYVTVDVVETCHRLFPDNYGYWLPGDQGGEARYDNVLTGEMTWFSATGASSGKAVHLEADRDLARVVGETEDGDPLSFYHRYSTLRGQVSDAREPLPTAWAMRFTDVHDEETETLLRVWKGSTNFATPIDLQLSPPDVSPDEFLVSNCHAYTYYAWDDEENIYVIADNPWNPISTHWQHNFLPLATQEIDLANLLLYDDEGWLLFVWPPSNFGQSDSPQPIDHYQTWMGVVHDAWGPFARFSTGTPAANANCFPDQILPGLGIDYEYVGHFGYRGLNGPLSGPPVVR